MNVSSHDGRSSAESTFSSSPPHSDGVRSSRTIGCGNVVTNRDTGAYSDVLPGLQSADTIFHPSYASFSTWMLDGILGPSLGPSVGRRSSILIIFKISSRLFAMSEATLWRLTV